MNNVIIATTMSLLFTLNKVSNSQKVHLPSTLNISILAGINLEKLTPTNIYLSKVNDKNTRKRCEICSKLTIKTPERRHWRRSGVFIVNFEHISHLFLVFSLLTLNKYMLAGT